MGDRDLLALLDGIADAVITLEPDLAIASWSRGAEELYGWRPGEVIGQHIGELLQSEFVTDSRAVMLAALRARGRWTGEIVQRRRDGGELHVHVGAAASRDADGELTRIVAINRDLSALRAVEHASRRLAAIVEFSDDAIVSTRLDGLVETWNAGAERLFGYSRAEAIGMSVARLAPPDMRTDAETLLAQVRRGKHVGVETTRRRRDGTPVDIRLSVSPIYDERGRVIGTSGIAHDISERRRLERQLIVTGRMLSLGTLAAGVAHEINNPLAYVMANLETLGRASTDREATETIQQALDGCDRIRRVVRQLKTFSRADEDRRVPLDVRGVLDLALALCHTELRHRARLVKDYRDVPAVDADESRLAQVFINLLHNAAQALPEGRVNEHEIAVACRPDGDRVVIEIRDTGGGIPEAIRARIFDPFFTTKPVGIGAGLGLAICHAIIASHHGEISFDSEVGRGTTFRVALPASAAGLAARDAAATEAERAGLMRLLVVDDEPMITMALARILGSDHEVTVACNGRAALDRFSRGERFDAIICDLMMPELTGMDLYTELSRLAPDQAAKMIFMTGGVFTNAGHAFLETVPNAHIEKPFPIATLKALVRGVGTDRS